MNAIDTFPAELPLREALPKMRPETVAALIAWALAQPGSMAWLLRRKYDYQDKLPGRPADEDHRHIEATCALELLRWRIAAATDRDCIDHLNTPLAKPA